tara:strand:- start:324 stop:518 length:195 start_codon:yes stop_codon:yes gene_type:complete
MDKARQIKFAKRKHIKQLKRNAKNKIGRQHRMEARIMMRQIRKAHADIPEDIVQQTLGQPSLAK